MKKHIFFTVFFIVTFYSFAQNNSMTTVLEEVVVIADKKIKNSIGYKIHSLNDSIISKNTASFTSLLRFNSPIYFREYGAGGTSSACFRGTNSSNTALIWNGININSINNGQAGFNSLTVNLMDAIDIRSGGGSIEYGSGAVGGTIHLNDYLQFKADKTIENELKTSIGSFDTYNALYKFNLSTKKVALKFGVSYNESENDYKLLGTKFKNSNGAYDNLTLNVGFAYKFSEKSELKFYSTNYSAQRLFSGELPNPTSANDKYKDFNNRNLIIYSYKKEIFKHELKIAFLTQEYQYFDNKDSEKFKDFNFGKSKRSVFYYTLGYKIPALKANITSYSEYESVFGKTDKISEKNRKQFSQSVVYHQNIADVISFDAKIRKDFNSDYDVPYSFAFGIKANIFKNISVRLNSSKNYRVPSYNDLYWPGQGNLNLVPETALQGEFGVGFKNSKVKADVGVFYITAKDKIVWLPNSNIEKPGVWSPINLSETVNKGAEFTFLYTNNFNKHFIDFNFNYSYIEAKNKKTNTFLIFTPKHLLNGNVSYSYKRFGFFYQQLFTGMTYTTQSNSNDFVIPSFFIANIGGDFKILKSKKQQVSIGFKLHNMFDKLYITQPRRPMPNRNFNININYKF